MLLPPDYSLTHDVGAVNHGSKSKLCGQLCCWLQLYCISFNNSSQGGRHLYCILIGIVLQSCIEYTAPTRWRVIVSCSQHLSPNHGLSCQ